MLLTRDGARELDRRAIQEYGVPGIVLMENAGRGMADLLRSLGISGPVVICCGKGNNGGDGFVIARHLDNVGVRVRVLLFADPAHLSGDASINYRIVATSEIPVDLFSVPPLEEDRLSSHFRDADWIVDALFGSGLRGPVQAPFDRIVASINASKAKVFAVDIPTGLDCDAGLPLGIAVRADHTATVAAMKKGFVEPSAADWLGRVHCIDMGAPRLLLQRMDE